MIKDIKYQGYSAVPSDYECSDGQLSTSLNLISEDNQLKPISQPKTIKVFTYGTRIVFIHKTSTYTHYITVTNDNVVCWSNDESTSGVTLHSFNDVEIYQFNAIGNTLLILASDGMHYFLWKGDKGDYLYLGTKIPECPISFGLQATLKMSDKFTITYEGIPQSEWNGKEFSDSNKAIITEQVMAKVNKFIADNATNDGKFIFPFFVRYAYRLYDGSLTMQSAPVLMVCASGLTPQCNVHPILKSGNWNESKAFIYAAFHDLDLSIKDKSCKDTLILWSDIVKSVDIFISEPIRFLDQSGMCKKFYDVEFDNYMITDYFCDSICKLTNIDSMVQTKINGLEYSNLSYPSMLNMCFPNELQAEEKYSEYNLELPHFTNEKFLSSFSSVSSFYYLSSIKVDNLSIDRNKIIVPKDYLQSLLTREVLPDDYNSHDSIIPKYSFVYNSRLNLCGIKTKIFNGFEPFSMFCYMNTVTDNDYIGSVIWDSVQNPVTFNKQVDDVEIFVHLKVDADESVVKVQGKVCCDKESWFWFYYPNNNAHKIDIVVNSVSRFVKLENHSFLNGAYRYEPSGFLFSDIGFESDYPEEKNGTYEVPNKIYTSEVNNPFYFPLLGINTVGAGDILGICSAARPLSEGQFGQFPLYAFTTEGVWALETTSTGTYSARQPITRDVCTNIDSITQLDSSVLFATARGIMLISGSNVQCISDAINTETPFDVRLLPCMKKLHAMLGDGHDLDSCIPAISFTEFLQKCGMLYDYVHQHIIAYHPEKTYAYVYSLKSKQWGMMYSNILAGVNSYPDALAVDKDYNLVNFALPPKEAQKGLLVTRPLKLETPDVLKTMDTVIQRGHFVKGHVQAVLYGSRDLYNWHLIWSSKDHYLRGFRGTPYKYFRIACITALSEDESLFGASLQFTPRQTNQPR